MSKTKERHVHAFHNTDEFLTSIFYVFLVVGCHWYERFQFLQQIEVFKPKTNINLIIKGNVVQYRFQFFTHQLIVNKRFFRLKVQVLLHCFFYQTFRQLLDFADILKLTLQHSQHSVTNSNHWKVLSIIRIMLLRPSQNFRYLCLNFSIEICLFCISWYVKSVKLFKQIY